MLKNLMGDNFELYSVMKPGSNSSHLLETMRQEIKQLSSDDIIAICCGMNDLATNKSALAFQNISNMVTRNNHTNIILINIPHRYDTTKTTTTNNNIEKFNKKLQKLIKVSPHARFLKN
jgi:lysophospholipase L1-like esterase